MSRLGQLQNYLWNVQRLVSAGTWLQWLGEEHCTLVKSLSQISEREDNSEVRLNVACYAKATIAGRGFSEGGTHEETLRPQNQEGESRRWLERLTMIEDKGVDERSIVTRD